jgi:two-component system chemotaxis response regulator CheB
MKQEVLPLFIKELQKQSSFKIESTPITNLFDTPKIIICQKSSILSLDVFKFELIHDDKHTNVFFNPDMNHLLSSFEEYMEYIELDILFLSGIGDDGVKSAKRLKQKGAKVFAQDEKSCAVYGMPRSAIENIVVDRVLTPDEIIEYLNAMV